MVDTRKMRSNNSRTDIHGYLEDDSEGFLYVREWETHRLLDEFDFLLELMEAVAGEIEHRAYSDETQWPEEIGVEISQAQQMLDTLDSVND